MSCINLPTVNNLVCGDAHHAAVPNLCYPMLSPKAREELQFPKHSRNGKRLQRWYLKLQGCKKNYLPCDGNKMECFLPYRNCC